MSLDTLLHETVRRESADFYGVADLTPAADAIRDQGGDQVASFPRGVSVGLRLFDPVVDQLPNRLDDPVHARNYGHHCYTLINQRLDLIASTLASVLQGQGHTVYPVPASQAVNTAELMGVFSHKMAAHMAGLGWIGKSCLLVTPEAGPRVRWATVLTDAPLAPTGQPMDSRCGSCRICVDACPPHAFTGRAFSEQEPRDRRFDVHKCHEYRAYTETEYGVKECGMCLYSCPHGRPKA